MLDTVSLKRFVCYGRLGVRECYAGIVRRVFTVVDYGGGLETRLETPTELVSSYLLYYGTLKVLI